MVQYRVIDEYENGISAVQGKEKFFVHIPEEERLELGSSAIGSLRRCVRVLAALCVRFNGLHERRAVMEVPHVVPVSVAVAGKPEIVAYLGAVHYEYYGDRRGIRSEELANKFDIDPETIIAYSRRVLESVEDQRVS